MIYICNVNKTQNYLYIKIMETTIYKANGKTFKNMEEVEMYTEQNDFVITNTESFNYKGKIIVCVNLKSK